MSLTEAKHLTDSELEYLLTLLQKHKGERDSIMLRLALYTGARGCELLRLTPKDFSKDGTCTLWGAKGSNSRTIPITSHDSSFPGEIRNYIAEHKLKPTERLFPISTRQFRNIWGVWTPNGHKSSHSMRHTVGIKLYVACQDVYKVKALLGHQAITSSLIYLNFCQGPRTLRKAMRGMWKKSIADEQE